ncbi:MAG TPA: MFS transporter [Steroidobacteraceae bacterium]|nr:MFS transporter [Steroidobacteraceae bacterium]
MNAHPITRRAVWGWITYDLANTMFSMGIVSLYFSLWVRGQVGSERADTLYGNISSVSYLLIFIVSPLLGAMTDRARRRMPFLVVSTLLCIGCTLLLGRVGFWPTMLAFIIANASYQAGLQFYDAMLPEVSTEENRGRISGIGVGIGYFGSFLAIGLGFITSDMVLRFTLVAVGFLVFALPCFLFVRERGNPHPRQVFSLRMIRESSAQTLATLRSGRQYPGLLRFLIGRVFYTDAINTVIAFMGLYVVNVAVASGRDEAAAQRLVMYVMAAAIGFAVVGGFVWGRWVDRIGPRRTLDRVLWLWVATFLLAAAAGLFNLPIAALFVVAVMAGVALGGIWSADRPLMLRLTPPDRIGEFYGLYGMVGRFSAIAGPFIWANVAHLATTRFGMPVGKAQGLNILVLLAFIIIARRILAPVTDEPRDWRSSSSAAAGASR